MNRFRVTSPCAATLAWMLLLGASLGSATTASAAATSVKSDAASVSEAAYSAAVTFYNSLSATQQSNVQLAWSLSAARKWSNLPAQLVPRNGVALGSLSDTQLTLAHKLIKAALSKKGKLLEDGLLAADNYLAANGGGSSYGQGNYYIAFLGTPSTTSFWMLQITGHHITYNLAFNGTYKSASPMFLGVEPKGQFVQDGKTWDPMSPQRIAFQNLGAALTNYAGAKLSGSYTDLIFGANGPGGIDGACPRAYDSVTDHGLLYSSLSATDQALVQSAIKAYVKTQGDDVYAELRSAYLSADALAQTYVAYSGTGTVTTKGNYFRIEGPRVWIELSVQNGIIFNNDIHYHGIWRDKLADYGGQCLS